MSDWRVQMHDERWQHTWMLEVSAKVDLGRLDAEATYFAPRLSDAPRAIISKIEKFVLCSSCGKHYGKGEADTLCDRGMPSMDRARVNAERAAGMPR